jgi:hypothetical protein
LAWRGAKRRSNPVRRHSGLLRFARNDARPVRHQSRLNPFALTNAEVCALRPFS